MSRPTVNIWWAQTTKPRIAIDIIAQIMLVYPNVFFFPV